MADHPIAPSTRAVQTQLDETRERRVPLAKRMLRSPEFVVGAVGIVLIVLVAYLAPSILQLDPYSVDPANRLASATNEHLLGTDTFGRDLLARILAGGQSSILVGFLVALFSGILGTAIGVLAAFSSVLDQILMRICDGLMAIPAILLAVALAAALGSNLTNLVIALSIVYTPYLARLVRARALAVKSDVYVEASISAGARPLHVMFRHILPNTLSVIVVQSTFAFAESVIVEAALSFLGAGVPAPTASWGNILYDGKSVILSSPQMVIYTSLALILTVLLLNLLGDGLRDLLDRRKSGGARRFTLFGMGRNSWKGGVR